MRIACDTGGTFTDLVVETAHGLKLFKASTTPDDPVRGVLDALALAAAAAGTDRATLLARTETFIHGTTRAINAILTGATARTAFLTTAGHPDILVIREGGRTVGAGVDRAGIEHPCAALASPSDSACEKRRRDPLPTEARLGHEAGDAPHPRVVCRSFCRRRRKAPRTIPARHIGARTDLDPADRNPAPIGEQPGWRARLDARPKQLPRAGPDRRLEVAPRHAPVHAPALAADAAPVAEHGFQIGPSVRRQRSGLGIHGLG